MQTVTALEAKNRFGELLDKAQREPVTVTKQGRPSVVVLSVIDYEKYDRFLRNDLLLQMKKSQDEAAKNGMTEDVLADLLKDES
jgi:prevent-host-death family protein